MRLPVPRARRLLLAFACLVLSSCSITNTAHNDGAVSLDDGLYPVQKREDKRVSGGARVVELVEVPAKDSADATLQTVLVVDKPVLRFREVAHHEFKFDKNNECTQIELENTDSLKAFTRNHIGARLAVVVDGKVVSSP